MRVLLSTYDSRGGVEPQLGIRSVHVSYCPIVLPSPHHPYWAGRVACLGIGTAHDGPAPTTESLSAALRTALTPETRARAAAVAGTIRADGATVAAELLADAVSRERPPASA